MHWIRTIEQWVRELAGVMPLDVFAFVGSFTEELIGPIPSTLVMSTAGALANLDGRTLVYLVWLAILGGLGKALATYVFYVIGDKGEDIVVRKFGSYLGVTHEDIEGIGKKFGKHHWKDGGLLFLLRAIPFFPTVVVSIACGVIKMDKKVFFLATFLGYFVKDALYVYSGYAGLVAVRHLMRDLIHINWELNILILGSVLGTMIIAYLHRHEARRWGGRLQAFFQKRKIL